MRNLNTIYLQIAGLNIKINFTPPQKKTDDYFSYNKLRFTISHYFSGFFLAKKPSKIDYHIELTKSNLLLHRQVNNGKITYTLDFYIQEKNKILSFQHISLAQFLLLLKQAINRLTLNSNLFLLHASASNNDGKALIFTGKPNAGKSTIMTMIKENYPPLADDSVIIKKNNFYNLYQTPFIEKNDWLIKTNKAFLIDKIFFLKKSKYFKVKKIINKKCILQRLLAQLIITKDNYKIMVKHAIEFVNNFNDFYYLYFAKDKKKLYKLLKSLT